MKKKKPKYENMEDSWGEDGREPGSQEWTWGEPPITLEKIQENDPPKPQRIDRRSGQKLPEK